MTVAQELDALGIDGYLQRYGTKELLRLLTCGSVDDGKSTLIGRLLHDAGALADDQLAAAERDSRRYGTTGDELDFALLVDGLEAERQQGITIDVAYRYFSTPKRKFIIADTPGHEQYTRNMATGGVDCRFSGDSGRRPTRCRRSDPPSRLYRHPDGHQTPGGGSQ